MQKDVEYKIMIDVIFSNCINANIEDIYNKVINDVRLSYKNRRKELSRIL